MSKFKQIAKVKISKTRNLVVSKTENGFILAQQLEVAEGSKTTSMFLKGSVCVESKEYLANLRDALNVALSEENENF